MSDAFIKLVIVELSFIAIIGLMYVSLLMMGFTIWELIKMLIERFKK